MRLVQYINESVVLGQLLESGTGLSRVMSKLKDDGVEFGIITAYRGSHTPSENHRRNYELLKDVRSILSHRNGAKGVGDIKGYGAYILVGHWKECSVTLTGDDDISKCTDRGGTLKDVLEESWLIVNEPKSDEFFDTLVKMAEKYDQDAFVSRVGDTFGVFGKQGNLMFSLGKVSKDTISSGFKRLISIQGYSELKKKRVHGNIDNIVFEDISLDGILVPKDCNSSHMLFSYGGILWK